MKDGISRREAMRDSVVLGFVAAITAAGCGKEPRRALSCMDTTGLSDADAQMRTTLAYVDLSTDPGKSCEKCQHFKAAPAPRACGACTTLKGPVNPHGNCKAFVIKQGVAAS